MHDGFRGDGWGGGHWVAVIVMMVLFWGAIGLVVLAVVRSGGWSHHHDHYDHRLGAPRRDSTDDAERILHERFARGEIDEAEYTRRHDLLKERSSR
jgi:putative membrane protein